MPIFWEPNETVGQGEPSRTARARALVAAALKLLAPWQLAFSSCVIGVGPGFSIRRGSCSRTKTRSCPRAATRTPIARIVGAPRLVRALHRRGMAEGAKAKLDAESPESTEVFPSPRQTSPRVAGDARLFPGGYDFLRLLGTALATNRSWPVDHRCNAAAYLRHIRDIG